MSLSFTNTLGQLALLAYVLTLIPGHCRELIPQLFKIKAMAWYFKNPNLRRNLGILSFIFALTHAIPIVLNRRWEFSDPKTYSAYFHGVLLLLIFAALTVTSNRWSQKKLKKNWKKLHELTYTAIFLLTWHLISAMWGKWSALTYLMILVMILMCCLFVVRITISYRRSHSCSDTHSSP